MDFINYFRQKNKKSKQEKQDTESQTTPSSPEKKGALQAKEKRVNQQVELSRHIVDSYNSKQARVDPSVRQRLNDIRDIVHEGPKENQPEIRFSKIDEKLGEAECHETVREERWKEKIICPYCEADDIKRLPIETQKSPFNYRYLCLSCDSKFNDDSETPFEQGVPPLKTWMQCWYLVGCTNSYQYIAAKLGLELALVERMINQLQKLFKAKQPLNKNVSNFDEWSKQNSELYEKKLQQAIQSKKVLLTGETTQNPTDTGEYRRQQERRRDVSKVTPPKNRKF